MPFFFFFSNDSHLQVKTDFPTEGDYFTTQESNIYWLVIFLNMYKHIVLCFCFVFLHLVYPMLPVSLDCPFLILS